MFWFQGQPIRTLLKASVCDVFLEKALTQVLSKAVNTSNSREPGQHIFAKEQKNTFDRLDQCLPYLSLFARIKPTVSMWSTGELPMDYVVYAFVHSCHKPARLTFSALAQEHRYQKWERLPPDIREFGRSHLHIWASQLQHCQEAVYFPGRDPGLQR